MARRSAAKLSVPSGLGALVRLVFVVVVYLAVLALAAVVFYGLGLSIVPDEARGPFGLLALGIAEAAALGSVLLFWHWVDARPLRELGLRRHGAVRRWLKGAAIATLMMGFVVLVGYTLLDSATWDVNSDALKATAAVLFGLVGFLIQGPAEEVLFRGYILENVRDQWGVRWAVGVSAVAFSLFHAANPGFGPLPFINLALFGVGTALYKLYVDDDQLWGVFGIHTVWNWLQQVVFGLPNSGNASVPDNTLFSITPNTSMPDVFWGGGFGPEGTVAASLVLLALLGASWRRAKARRSCPTTGAD